MSEPVLTPSTITVTARVEGAPAVPVVFGGREIEFTPALIEVVVTGGLQAPAIRVTLHPDVDHRVHYAPSRAYGAWRDCPFEPLDQAPAWVRDFAARVAAGPADEIEYAVDYATLIDGPYDKRQTLSRFTGRPWTSEEAREEVASSTGTRGQHRPGPLGIPGARLIARAVGPWKPLPRRHPHTGEA